MAAMPYEFFSAAIEFSVKLFGWLDRRHSCRPMAGFFLATPGDLAGLLEKSSPAFYFSTSSYRAEKPAIVNIARIHF